MSLQRSHFAELGLKPLHGNRRCSQNGFVSARRYQYLIRNTVAAWTSRVDSEVSWFCGQTDLTLSETLSDEASAKVAAPSVHETPRSMFYRNRHKYQPASISSSARTAALTKLQARALRSRLDSSSITGALNSIAVALDRFPSSTCCGLRDGVS